MPSTQTPEYTVRLRTPHEHQREKEKPKPLTLTSAGASGKGRMPMWRSPAVGIKETFESLRYVQYPTPRLTMRGSLHGSTVSV
jgi:hypothetical protein